jgi:hypothetical protein
MRSLASPPPQWLSEAIERRGVGLEDELRTDLTDTARCSRGGLTELAAVGVADYTARKEVGVVEDIKHLEAHIQCHALRDFRIFFHAQIRANPSRSREQELLGAARHAANFVAAAKTTSKG